MNNSGLAVKSLCAYFKIALSNVLIISDDKDMPFGQLRLRQHGSSGGHKGLASIIEMVKTNHFCRLKVGIGHPKSNSETVSYVLSRFNHQEMATLAEKGDKVVKILAFWLTNHGDYQATLIRFAGFFGKIKH